MTEQTLTLERNGMWTRHDTRPLTKDEELIAGRVYFIRLTSLDWTRATFQRIRFSSWLKSRTMKHYMFVNERTGRDIEIKSRERIRLAAEQTL